MKFALLQTNWNFAGSTYFGCPETHLPFELLYARQSLQAAGHDVLLLDAHLENLELDRARARLAAFTPDFLVLGTAPTYLFWRCPQPELRLPAQWLRELRGSATTVAIGPHGSATPAAVLAKLECDVVLRGEPEQQIARLADTPWREVEGCCFRDREAPHISAQSPAADLRRLHALDYAGYPLHRRHHRHHVFTGQGRGAEVEFSRGCPWACTFCNKTLFRNRFRERHLDELLAEIDALLAAGFDYLYFIDEIFGCGPSTGALLEALASLPLTFGMQTRIDLWDEDSLARLGRAHCVSLECGIESITAEGRARFRKGCRLSTDLLQSLLRAARRHIPWVQANLIGGDQDDPEAIAAWRRELNDGGIWASQPVPVFPYPGSPLYQSLFGAPDSSAWERAHDHYLAGHPAFSDIQDARPLALSQLEAAR